MRDGGRIAAAIEILEDFDARRVPLKVCMADWARGARYAGARDRAFISGLALDVLRRRGSLIAAGGNYRGAVALALHHLWKWDRQRIIDTFAEEPHGPGALEDALVSTLSHHWPASDMIRLDVPAFTYAMIERVSAYPLEEITASSRRAPVDLRINSLKSDAARVMKALAPQEITTVREVSSAIRIPPVSADQRGPAIDIHPAYQKGWMEVQDAGSQIAALATGPVRGKQVLDYCAGGGGKSLALAALMANHGQIFAYDIEARRLAPLYERAKRAGVRNIQIISPASGSEKLTTLEGRMDVVFLDAPCSGSGTWRRRPDTKWRLTAQQLEQRMTEQDEVLKEGAKYVRPGGTMIYVTCSIFAEENEDRIAHFIKNHPDFTVLSARSAILYTGLVKSPDSIPVESREGTLRLTPATTSTDGFAITRLVKRS